MGAVDRAVLADEPRSCSTAELGESLAGWAVRTAAAECRWLGMLAEFDLREGWYGDGQLSAADRLVWRCGMSARTARDKLRVAHELRRRPVVADAFGSGSCRTARCGPSPGSPGPTPRWTGGCWVRCTGTRR
ncbi:MAG: hypothetical protein M3144_12865 [Actinomycetota bacterium]|nr:hypothetical protein [Actinomycetota bacterium]